MRNGLPVEQGSRDVHAVPQPRITALGLLGPSCSPVIDFVERLAAAERQPEAARKHFADRRRGLRQHRRMMR